MISSVPTVRTLIPLLPSGMEMEGDEIFKLTSKDGDISVEKEKVAAAEPKEFAPDMIFEQEPSQLLNAILPAHHGMIQQRCRLQPVLRPQHGAARNATAGG